MKTLIALLLLTGVASAQTAQPAVIESQPVPLQAEPRPLLTPELLQADELIQSGQRRTIAGVITTLVGVGALAVGAAIYTSAHETQSDYVENAVLPKVMGGMIGGAGVIVTSVGIGLWYSGSERLSEGRHLLAARHSLSLAPAPAGSLAGGSLALTF